MARMKYVQRRANRFEFRFPLPDDLAGQAAPQPWPEGLAPLLNPKTGRLKTEIIRSLQTTDGKAAERRALAHIGEAHRLVDVMKVKAEVRSAELDNLRRAKLILKDRLGDPNVESVKNVYYRGATPPHDGDE